MEGPALPAAAVEASCASVAPSVFSFSGVVVDVRDRGRVAIVRTDARTEVVVDGSPQVVAGVPPLDRYFVEGARYEFHPRNAHSPFADDACTATRLLSPSAEQPAGGDADALPWWLPVDEHAGWAGYAPLGAGVLALLGAGVLAARRRTHAPVRPVQDDHVV